MVFCKRAIAIGDCVNCKLFGSTFLFSKMIEQKSESNKLLKKSPFWFYIILISIPFVFIILLELALRYFDYGYDFKYFAPASEYNSDKYFANPDLPRKYFFNI